MASHPYISGAGNITQMIGYLRKNFPGIVTSDTVKKFSIAPNNESYVINALQFIGVIDEEGKRTDKGRDIFVLADDKFPEAFKGLIREAYRDLFELRGDDAWTLSKGDLVSYFRTTDKTSEAIGGRQAGVFQAFRELAGCENEKASSNSTPKSKTVKSRTTLPKKAKSTEVRETQDISKDMAKKSEGHRGMAMTVRIEINLPANGSQETYDAIFKSIRANLINE
jgi:hypothetical protein